jgi:ActR/RegA family two-component response regulator
MARILVVDGSHRGATYLDLAHKLGANRILAKPFTSQEILAAINDVLGS